MRTCEGGAYEEKCPGERQGHPAPQEASWGRGGGRALIHTSQLRFLLGRCRAGTRCRRTTRPRPPPALRRQRLNLPPSLRRPRCAHVCNCSTGWTIRSLRWQCQARAAWRTCQH